MSYSDLANSLGRQAVQIVELYLPKCTRTYGTAPCTAAVGVTGTDRCYNTRSSCQDSTNFSQTTQVYRFATTRVDGIQQVGEPPTFPTVLSVDTAATILTPSQGLGVRASVSITLADHPWTDSGIDPYLSLRGFDPDKQGTFWGRMIARHRYYENRRIDVLTGFLNEDGSYDAANFMRRSYVISRISGPGASGQVTVEGRDPLSYADGEKAKWPLTSDAVLSSDITDTVTSISISDPSLLLTDWWALGQRYLKCEQEVMRATAMTGAGTSSVTLTVVRANMPSIYDPLANIASAHSADATIQACHWFDHQMVYDIVYFLLLTVAKIPVAYLDYAVWKSYFDDQFPNYRFSALVAEPTSVKDLLTEITNLNVLLFWHDRTQKIAMRALRYTALLGAQLNEDTSIIADSLSVTDDVRNLATRSIIYYDLQWPLALMKELKSFRVVDVQADLEREGSSEYGLVYTRQITSRWLFRENNSLVGEINGLYIRQYKDVRRSVTVYIDPKDDTRWTGDMVGVSSRYMQDEYGNAVVRNYLITEVREEMTEAGLRLRYTLAEVFSYVREGVIAPDSPGDAYSSATAADKDHYAFISPDTPTVNPQFADGTPSYQIV